MECFRARRCRIGGIEGELGISRVVARVAKSDVFVLRLSWLGFRFIAGIAGLMNEGEVGSDTMDVVSEPEGGWIERPFIFLGFLGAGDVMGRSRLGVDRLRLVMPFRPEKEGGAKDGGAKEGGANDGGAKDGGANDGGAKEGGAKDMGAKDERGARCTGESGDEDGEGSERSEESVQDIVVVGDESSDSVAWVDVLSLCLWPESDDRLGRKSGCSSLDNLVSSISITNLGSTTFSRLGWTRISESTSKTDMKEGI